MVVWNIVTDRHTPLKPYPLWRWNPSGAVQLVSTFVFKAPHSAGNSVNINCWWLTSLFSPWSPSSWWKHWGFHALFIALFMPQAAVPDPEQCLPRLSWCSEHSVSLLGAGSGCSPRAELEESALQSSWPLNVCGEISSCQVVLVLLIFGSVLSLLLPGWCPWVQHRGYFLGSNNNKKPQSMVIRLWWPSLSVVSCSWGSPNLLWAQKCSARTILHSLLPWSLVLHSQFIQRECWE